MPKLGDHTDQIPVGFVTRAHGIRGDLLVVPLTDYPDRFAVGARFSADRAPYEVNVRTVQPHNRGVVVGFEEFPDRTAAEGFVKATLTIPADDRRPLEGGEYWPDDLIGLEAVDANGVPLGRVTDVVVGAAQDRLVVATPSGALVEVPFVSDIVGEPADGLIPMEPPTGLFERSPADEDL